MSRCPACWACRQPRPSGTLSTWCVTLTARQYDAAPGTVNRCPEHPRPTLTPYPPPLRCLHDPSRRTRPPEPHAQRHAPGRCRPGRGRCLRRHLGADPLRQQLHPPERPGDRHSACSVRAVIGKKIGVAATDDRQRRAACSAVAQRAVELARLQQENEDFVSLPGPTPIIAKVAARRPQTAECGPERARRGRAGRSASAAKAAQPGRRRRLPDGARARSRS